MNYEVSFPQGLSVDVDLGEHKLHTDQSKMAGGEGSGPAPFSVFLGSLAACAGFYVLAFCRQRDLSVEGITVTMSTQRGGDGRKLSNVKTVIRVPEAFPQKYRDALAHAASSCAVKKVIENPPDFETSVETA